MRALIALLLHILLTSLLLAAGPASAQAHAHATAPQVAAAAVMASPNPAPAHIACDPHRNGAQGMATHGSTPRCKQACLALSAGFSAVLPMQAHALWLVDGASLHPDAHHALPAGRVVMPERRPPKAA